MHLAHGVIRPANEVPGREAEEHGEEGRAPGPPRATQLRRNDRMAAVAATRACVSERHTRLVPQKSGTQTTGWCASKSERARETHEAGAPGEVEVAEDSRVQRRGRRALGPGHLVASHHRASTSCQICHLVPDLRRELLPLFLKRQCGRALPPPAARRPPSRRTPSLRAAASPAKISTPSP